MVIKTPNILPGEKGYVPKKERTAAKKVADKKAKKVAEKKEMTLGKIKAGGRGFRIGKPSTTYRGEKKYPIWRYSKRIGEISIKGNEIEMSFVRLGGVGNYRHLIQDADFQMEWAVKEQELLMTQGNCFVCEKKLSRSAAPHLYHTKMWQRRAELLERADEVPEEVVKGKLTIEEGWNKFNNILEEGNRYFMSLKDTALVCASCAKSKGLE